MRVGCGVWVGLFSLSLYCSLRRASAPGDGKTSSNGKGMADDDGSGVGLNGAGLDGGSDDGDDDGATIGRSGRNLGLLCACWLVLEDGDGISTRLSMTTIQVKMAGVGLVDELWAR